MNKQCPLNRKLQLTSVFAGCDLLIEAMMLENNSETSYGSLFFLLYHICYVEDKNTLTGRLSLLSELYFSFVKGVRLKLFCFLFCFKETIRTVFRVAAVLKTQQPLSSFLMKTSG